MAREGPYCGGAGSRRRGLGAVLELLARTLNVAIVAGIVGMAYAQRPESVCSYTGRYNVKSDMVRDVCPPPVNNGMYYLVLDIDPGMSSEVTMHAYTVSPESAECARGACSSPIDSGYDIFMSDTCLPTREFQGLTLTNGMIPNVANTTVKSIVIKMVSKGRLYIGLGKKYRIKDDSDSCSVRFVPGALEASGFASGSSCVISDYEEVPGDGIFPCTAETRLTSALELPPWVMGAAGAGGAFLAMFTLGIMCWTDRRRKRRMALQSAEDQFRDDMVKRAKRRDRQIQMAAIDVIGADQTYKSSKVVPWRDDPGRYGSEVGGDGGLDDTFGDGWGKDNDRGKDSSKGSKQGA